MMSFLSACGVWAWPLLAMAVAVLVLAVKKSVDLFVGTDRSRARLERGLHAILFWGALSAVTGILGQASGIYNAMTAVSGAREISPQVVAMGIAQSLTSTIFGMTVFIIAAILWFALYTRLRRLVLGAE